MNKQLASQQTLQKAFKHFQQGNFALAEKSARKALSDDPRNVALLQFVGILCNKQDKHADAAVLCAKAVQLDPASGEAHYNLGTALVGCERWAEAIASLSRSLELLPGNYDALANLGYALLKANRSAEAEAPLRRAIALQPNAAAAYHTLGVVMKTYGRFAEAIDLSKMALARRPAEPAEVFFDYGQTLLAADRPADAIGCYREALKLAKPSSKVLYALGEAQHAAGQHADAAKSYADALALAPGDLSILIGLLNARLHIADWRDYSRLTASLSANLESSAAVVNPFVVMTLLDDPAAQHRCAQRHALDRAAAIARAASPVEPRAASDRIRLAYVSSDFRTHPVAALTAGLYEHHDRSRFDVVAISLHPGDGSPMRHRLEAAFDQFVDVGGLSTQQAAQVIREQRIDIAVDLNGYTRSHRCEILASRPARVQVNYLGYPGTMGADWIDYVIADAFVVPEDRAQHFSEKIVRLPDCFQANDRQRAIDDHTPTRSECGLPENAFVFCSFNNIYKLNPAVFDIWMRLLAQVPGSVLWLFAGNQSAEANLAREAQARGIDASRLIFAGHQGYPQHLARQRLADLFLDSWPYNAGTTTSDALWAGLPVLTYAGRGFAARMAGSLLYAVGLPDLVTHSPEDYEALALRLALTPDLLGGVRRTLAANIATAPLFDTPMFTRQLEAAYEEMWQRWRDGSPPATINLTRQEAQGPRA